jgi:hypothetical protein
MIAVVADMAAAAFRYRQVAGLSGSGIPVDGVMGHIIEKISTATTVAALKKAINDGSRLV